MTVADPEHGSFRSFSGKVLGPGVGFVVGWVYWTGLVLAMSSEAIAVSILLRTWAPGISLPLVGSIVIILVTLLNLLGADKLSKLESGLAAIKLLAIVGFILLGVVLIAGIGRGEPGAGAGALRQEAWFPGGIGGIAGSMLIVMFTYAGFEVISLAASEASNAQRTVPKAIAYTVTSLVGLYVAAVVILLPLVPVNEFTQDTSPMVLALTRWNLGWAGGVMNIVLITAIISTMLAAMFGLGRMIRSLTDDGQAPVWLKDKGNIPYRGILFSGAAMLAGLFFSFFLPQQVYIFLVSSGGFSLLFAYLVILITHYKFRKENGCPPNGRCQLPGYPATSWISIASLVAIILSMPLIPGQGYGLLAGIILTSIYAGIYFIRKSATRRQPYSERGYEGRPVNTVRPLTPQTHMEASKELSPEKSDEEEKKL
jgi:AAT family amino acid transporter